MNKKQFTITAIVIALLSLTAFWFIPSAKAYENYIVINTTTDVISSVDGQCSLREAVIAANTNTASGVVLGECPAGKANEVDYLQLEPGETYALTINGDNEDAAATGDLDIIDNPIRIDVVVTTITTGTAVIKNMSPDRVFHVIGPDTNVRFENVEITGGNNQIGGGIYSNGHILVRDSILSLNIAVEGGAIYNDEGQVEIYNSSLTRNMVVNAGSGAGIYNANGYLTINDSTITGGNASSGSGAGLTSKGGTVEIHNTRFSSNINSEKGGAIYNLGAEMTITNSEITGLNKATFGGGIYNTGTLNIEEGTSVDRNIALNGNGAGIYNEGKLVVRDSTINKNEAQDPDNNDITMGGGIFATTGSETSLIRSSLYENSADAAAGLMTDGLFQIFNSTISRNNAIEFAIGGIAAEPNSEGLIGNNTIVDNEAAFDDFGVALHINKGSVVIANNIFANAAGKECTVLNGSLTSLGSNLADDDTCAKSVSDLINTDPMLLPFNTDGYYELADGSPAINAGNNSICESAELEKMDQLKRVRPLFGSCDIGSTEYQGHPVYLPLVIK